MQIGFVGLGNMGAPMALRLVKAGLAPRVFDLNADAVRACVAAGAVDGQSIAAIACDCELVFLSLPSPAIVKAVAIGPDGLASGGAVRIVVDLSTTGATTAHEVDRLLREKGISLVDAPVSGGVVGAHAGTLAVMAAAPTAMMAIVEPLLSQLGRVFHVGETAGLGQTMKLVNNFISATTLAITSEAVVVGTRHGLTPAKIIEVLNAGSGRTSASLDKFPRAVLPGTYDLGFTIGLMCKDLALYLDEAAAVGLTLRTAAATDALWREMRDLLGPDADFSRIIQPMAEEAGVKINED